MLTNSFLQCGPTRHTIRILRSCNSPSVVCPHVRANWLAQAPLIRTLVRMNCGLVADVYSAGLKRIAAYTSAVSGPVLVPFPHFAYKVLHI